MMEFLMALGFFVFMLLVLWGVIQVARGEEYPRYIR